MKTVLSWMPKWIKKPWGAVAALCALLAAIAGAIEAAETIEPFAWASHRWTRAVVTEAQADDIEARGQIREALFTNRIDLLALTVAVLDVQLLALASRLDTVRLRLGENPGDQLLRDLKTTPQQDLKNTDDLRDRTDCQKSRLESGAAGLCP